jgi:TonB family protein
MDPSFSVTSSRVVSRIVAMLASVFVFAATASAQGDFVGTGLGGDVPLATMLDSAALVHTLTTLSVPELPQGVAPLFAVNYDSTGAVKEVTALFAHLLPASYADPVAAAIRSHLKAGQPELRSRQLYLRADAGAHARVESARLPSTGPELLNRPAVAMRIAETLYGLSARTTSLPQTEYQTDVRFRVGEDGTADPSSVEVVRSSSAATLDSVAIAVVLGMRFRPATLAGVPVKAWVSLPLGFRLPPLDVAPSGPLSVIVDSAAVARVAAGLAAPTLPHGVEPLFRVSTHPTGMEVELAAADIPASYADPVVAAIRANLTPRRAMPWREDVYLRVVGGARPAVRRASITREAALANGRDIDGMAREVARNLTGRISLPIYVARMKVRVLADGGVDPESVSVAPPASGEELPSFRPRPAVPVPELDAEAVRIARQMRFRPREVEGTPVPSWRQENVVFGFNR